MRVQRKTRSEDKDSVDETAAGERREARPVGAWERSELGFWMGIEGALRLVLVSSAGRADRKALPQSRGCVVWREVSWLSESVVHVLGGLNLEESHGYLRHKREDANGADEPFHCVMSRERRE